MLTTGFFGGRLAEVMQTIASLFHLAYVKKINKNDVVIDVEYVGKDFYKNTTSVFMDNFPMFNKIKQCFRFGLDYNTFIDVDISKDWRNIYVQSKSVDFKKNIRIINNWYDFIVNTRIYKELYYQPDLWKQYKEKHSEWFQNKTLGIHVRRKDFVLIHDNPDKYKREYGQRGVMDIQDINKKIFNISDYLIRNNFNIIVFSDDIEYCQQHFDFGKINNVYYSVNNKPYEDMILMSICDNLIRTKGSTFSKMALSLKV